MPVTMKDIVSFDVSENHIKEALAIRELRDKKFGNYFEVKDKDMRHCGEIGEIILNEQLIQAAGPYYTWHNEGKVNHEPDFTLFGRKFDLKTVKRAVSININYEAQVTAKQVHTPVDDYVFACFEVATRKLHVLGVMSKVKFINQARYFGPGDKVHANYTIREGHEIYNVYIKQLFPFRKYIEYNKSMLQSLMQTNQNM